MYGTKIDIIDGIRTFISISKENRIFFLSDSDFRRERKLNFENTVALILRLLKKSLNVELYEFFDDIGKDETCTKSAFTQQRKKIDYSFFKYLSKFLVMYYYEIIGNEIKHWKGFRLLAVDGSRLNLVNKPDLLKEFGVQVNQASEFVMSLVMNCYDVLNAISIESEILPIKTSELSVAHQWASNLFKPKDLVLYDRGFGSFSLFWMHSKSNERLLPYAMRVKVSFNNKVKEFVKSKKTTAVVTLIVTNKAIESLDKIGYHLNRKETVKVRLVRVVLSTGEVEVIATNLYDSQMYPSKIFKELYFMRWGVEVEFGAHKNIYQMEQQSGYSVNTIKQDFYTNIFISNLHNIFMKIDYDNSGTKYKYKTNRNVTSAILRDNIMDIVLNPEKESSEIVDDLKKYFLMYKEPIRPDRKVSRKFKATIKGKYRTVTNFKRAI
jgi:hypothetical protein